MKKTNTALTTSSAEPALSSEQAASAGEFQPAFLRHLEIDQFALIDHLDWDLGAGFTALTGETGAGKSILLDAVGFIAGARSRRELVRKGSAAARVAALFQDALPLLPPELAEELALTEEEKAEGSLLLSRQLDAAGRSLARINGRTVSLHSFRELGRRLFVIHAQNEQVDLFREEKQAELLDRFARDRLAAPLADWQALRSRRIVGIRALRRLGLNPQERSREIDLLRFQIGEIRDAAFQEGELESLKQRLRQFTSREKLRRQVQQSLQVLDAEEEAGAGALQRLEKAATALNGLTALGEPWAGHSQKLNSLSDALHEESRALGRDLEAALAEREDPRALEARIQLGERLAAKYGADAEAQALFLEKAEARLDLLAQSESRFHSLRTALQEDEKRATELAATLHARRQEAASLLEKQITESLQNLNMRGAEFRIELRQIGAGEPHFWGESGRDQVRFLIRSNPGEDLLPLARIASGGEVSRILLAIKSILADLEEIPVLIFDEIDTGISGDTAARLGRALARLARGRQVLAVTHTAQIGAAASQQAVIEKEAHEGRTSSLLRPLRTKAERVTELARLLVGQTDDRQARQLAESLLNSRAQSGEAPAAARVSRSPLARRGLISSPIVRLLRHPTGLKGQNREDRDTGTKKKK